MSIVLYISPDPRFEARLDAVLGRGSSSRQRWHDDFGRINPNRIVEACGGSDVEVVCVGPGLPPAMVLGIASAFDRERPDVCVLLLAEPTAELWAGALRTGARDVIAPGTDVATLTGALRRAMEVARRRRSTLERAANRDEPTTANKVITVLSPKGGSGKTTIATNLAVGLGRLHPGEVVLVDLDLQFGDVAASLGLTPTQSMADVTQAPTNLDATMLKVFLTKHGSGVYALCAPETPNEADAISTSDIGTVIDLLRAEFRYVIIDTGAGLNELDLIAVEVSTDLLFVGSMDVASARSLRKELDILDRLGLLSSARHLILNRSDAKVGMDAKDIEALLGMPVAVSVPSSRLIPISCNEGQPVLESAARSPVARALEQLVDRFTRRKSPEPSPSGLRRIGRKESP
jgi:pilus assembly protein CpaE